jgi:hypothetical protein
MGDEPVGRPGCLRVNQRTWIGRLRRTPQRLNSLNSVGASTVRPPASCPLSAGGLPLRRKPFASQSRRGRRFANAPH